MQKLSVFLLLIAFCFAACAPGTGCGKAANDPKQGISVSEAAPASEEPAAATEEPEQWDFDNRFGMGYTNVVETDEAYYYCSFSGGYLYYYDKASGVRGALCARPECVHDTEQQNTDCGGYIDAYVHSLNLIEGRLCYLSYERGSGAVVLCSVEPDGTDRQIVCTIAQDTLEEIGAPQRLDYHRGKLYGFCIYENVENAEPLRGLKVISIDPETGACRQIYDTGNTVSSMIKLYYYGRYVYFCVSEAVPLKGLSSVTVMRWDIEAEELSAVFASVGSTVIGTNFNIIVESEDELYLVPTAVESGNARVYRILEGELKTAFEFDRRLALYAAGDTALGFLPEENIMEIRSLKDGSLIFEGAWDISFIDELGGELSVQNILSAYGDSREVFITYFLTGGIGSGRKTCLVRYDLTQEHPRGELLAFSPWA